MEETKYEALPMTDKSAKNIEETNIEEIDNSRGLDSGKINTDENLIIAMETSMDDDEEESESSSKKSSKRKDKQKEKKAKIVSCFDALMHTLRQMAITVFFTCKKVATVSFGVLKKIAITALGPLLDYGLYYYDLYSDTYFTYTLANNCHWRFFASSIGILVSSYIITVVYLRCHLQENWMKSFMFPYHHGKNLFDQMKGNTIAIWRGEELPEQNEKDKSYGHCIIYFETMTESLMQLCLNTLVLREFGLSPNHFEASNQLSGLFSSLLSIILLFAKTPNLVLNNGGY